MGIPLTPATARAVRAAIAASLTNDGPSNSPLGDVTLHSHQRRAVTRIQAALVEFGGAVLADATGLGKTYVALAVAREAQSPIIVAPAGLREMWRAASLAARRPVRFISIESLWRRQTYRDSVSPDPDFVIIDEAHHLRNPATARYRAVAALTRRARVLLLSATPIHNSERDLSALLGLFLGARAASLDANGAMRCVIRRTAAESAARVPVVDPPRRLVVPDDEHRMEAILALPPPTPPADGGDGGILLRYSLLRRWASSQGALADSLHRRLGRATALLAALEEGRYPSSGELAAWSYADGTMQLAFPELAATTTVDAIPASTLSSAIYTHAAAVRALLDELRRSQDIDAHRANHLRAIRAAHTSEKVVAFTEYAETVAALYRQLRHDPGVAALTSAGARVAGGMLSRAEALARFAPSAQGARDPGRAYRIDLLLTTDLLSEGVNLQDASVVVHLDLPWTPARLEQRVGRAARIGSSHERVTVYAMQPPASSERLVRVEERLRAKLGATARAVGVVGTILPSLALRDESAPASSPPEWSERLIAAASGWLADDVVVATTPIVAAVRADLGGFIAVVCDDRGSRLVGALGAEATDAPDTMLRALGEAGGGDAEIDAMQLERARDALRRWRSAHRDHRDVTLDGALHARSRRTVVDRIAAIARRAPRHRRPEISALAAVARQTVTAHYGVGAEQVLEQLAAADMPDEAWLRAVGTFGAIHDLGLPSQGRRDGDPWVTALLLLVAPRAAET
jgi:superfamily II DNA or RNA helicase